MDGSGPQVNYGYAGQPATSHTTVVMDHGGQMAYQVPPQDYTTSAWLACLCCFWPTGLIAIMRASESRDCLDRGDMVGAHQAADGARMMVRVSVIVGVVSVVLAIVFIIIWFAALASAISNTGY